MPCYVYILRCTTTGRYYCGQTNDLARRLRQHNDPDYHGSLTTKRWPGPWELVWSESLPDRATAMRRERQIKKCGVKRFYEERSDPTQLTR